MNRKIRQGVFETNSSSTHSICIVKTADIRIPASLHLTMGEFGWECENYNDSETKASYLYTGLLGNGREADVEKLIAILSARGVAVTKDEPVPTSWGFDGGYVDHADELGPFLNAVMDDEEMLMRFLFSGASTIETGNDNDDSDVGVLPEETHDSFYKGN